MSGPFKMKGFGGFGNSPMKQDEKWESYYPDKEPGDNYYNSPEWKEKLAKEKIRKKEAKEKSDKATRTIERARKKYGA